MGNLFPLYVIAASSTVIPVSVGVYLYRRLSPDMKILLFLFAMVVLVEGYTFYQTLNKTDYYWIHHIYMPFEYGLMVFVFSCWQKRSLMRRALRISIIIFLLVCVADVIASRSLNVFNDLTAPLAYTLYVGISAYTLMNLQKEGYHSCFKNYRFWVGSALLLYSSGSLAYFAFFDYFLSFGIWGIHAVLNIIAHILYSIGFICQTRH